MGVVYFFLRLHANCGLSSKTSDICFLVYVYGLWIVGALPPPFGFLKWSDRFPLWPDWLYNLAIHKRKRQGFSPLPPAKPKCRTGGKWSTPNYTARISMGGFCFTAMIERSHHGRVAGCLK